MFKNSNTWIELRLSKNLRKTILQGSPWIYDQALQVADANASLVGLCLVKDLKNEFVCWGIYSPGSQLAVRVLSLDKKIPDRSYIENVCKRAQDARRPINRDTTNCYRLFNGEGDYLPGLVCDVYKDVAVLQCDGLGPDAFWDKDFVAHWLLENTSCLSVYYKARHDLATQPKTWGKSVDNGLMEVKENDIRFLVNVIDGQKTGFFLDQRDNRNYLRTICREKTVLNLFSYTGGFSVYAGMGGAKAVRSVDIAQAAVSDAQKNWELNGLDADKHQGMCADVFDYLKEDNQKFDVVICDPPSLAKSEKHKDQAIAKYVETFFHASKKVNHGGHLVLSSCSSHINFDDFHEITALALSKARKRGQVLRMSGQGADHPFPHVGTQLRYLKFVDLLIS